MANVQQRVRIKDVAERAGVSPMAVSAALNGCGRISTTKAEYIRQLAQQMGYRTNAVAQILKRKQGNDIGLVIMETAQLIRPNTSLAEMTIVFSESCRRLKIRPQIEWLDYQKNPQQVPDMFFNGLVNGILIHGYGNTHIADVLAHGLSLPFVRMMEPGDYSVYLDTRQEIVDLMTHLVGHGHRRIAMINGVADSGFHVFKTAKASFHDEVRRHGLAGTDIAYEEMRENSLPEVRRMAQAVMAQRPTAIVMHCASYAKSLICELIMNGVMVPRDVSVACYGTQDFDCEFNIPITATHSDIAEVVRQAVALLRARMADPALPPTSVAIRSSLHQGQSVQHLA